LHLIKNKLPFDLREDENILGKHINLSGGYNYAYNPGVLDIQGSGLIKTDFKKLQIDLGAKALYLNQFVGGLNFHTGDALSAIFGYYISSNFYLGYSYDLTISHANPFGGKNEFYINYCQNINIPYRLENHHLDTRNL